MVDILYVFALEEEAGEYLKDKNILFTGVGKVNATYSLTETILKDKPKLIVNFGSAGSKKYNKGSLVGCDTFFQRDMDCSVFGYSLGVTPQDKNSIVYSHFPVKLDNVIEGGHLGTGDSFDSNLSIHSNYTVVDMEGYALAKVCHLVNIPFLCIKYITDGADGGSGGDWSQNVKKAGFEFYKISEQIKKILL